MSDKLEDFLETAKMYIGIIFAMLLCLDVILSVAMYEKYGIIFGYNNLLDITIEVLFILTTVLFLTFVVLTIILKVHQGDMYISIGDMVDTVISFLFPVDAKSKKEISQILSRMGNKDSIISTELWKKATKGINIWNLVKSIFAYVFGISILYVVIKGWLDMDDQRLLMTVLGGLFIIVLFFWGTAWAFGVKKRPDDLLDYLILHELKFEELNRDFYRHTNTTARYMEEKNIFLSMQIRECR